ncbi:MAG: hypothetical protein KIS81_11745 [Maricaulaceae bacterium]|nr:hypothetical protein [Maricaulaceae bacterium]
MGIEHNMMALELSSVLLQQLRTGNASGWADPRLSAQSTLWQGMADWPRPDVAFEDKSTKSTLALEFKPPNQVKREYITGLGQMITYLSDFEFAGLVVPKRSGDGFEIAKYISDVLSRDLDGLPVALFSYDKSVSDFTVLRRLKPRTVPLASPPAGSRPRTFWAYWRDLSNYDLFEILRISDISDGQPFEAVFAKFWKQFAATGKARTWEGTGRKKKKLSSPSQTAERLNAFLAVRHAGLLSSDGRLTSAGLELLQVGKVYGPDSVAFIDLLAHSILVDGRHLDLIFWVEERTRSIDPTEKNSANEYLSALDKQLVDRGVIPPRKAGAKKPHFIRDEPKLWNKLGLLKHDGATQYFHAGHGFVFDWRRIIAVIEGR